MHLTQPGGAVGSECIWDQLHISASALVKGTDWIKWMYMFFYRGGEAPGPGGNL